MSKQKYGKYRTLEQLLKDLDKPFKFLVTQIDVPCQSADDSYQDLIQNVIEVYNKDPEYCSERKLGWWFIKGRWFLQKCRKTALFRNPLSGTIAIPDLGFIDEYVGGKRVLFSRIKEILRKLIVGNEGATTFTLNDDLKHILTKAQIYIVKQKLMGEQNIDIAKKLNVCPATITKRMQKIKVILRKYLNNGYK